jgi:hypothetical protein
LRVAKNFRHGENFAGGHACAIQHGSPVRSRAMHQGGFDFSFQRGAVGQPVFRDA